MKAVITRQISILGDNKAMVTFTPSTKKTPFVDVSGDTYRRLLTANAAKPFLEVVHDKDKAEDKVKAKAKKTETPQKQSNSATETQQSDESAKK